jgi:predicted subunit of tRNA(5-methylaminomethyl-2-thiouridylate) methyltransferase
MKITKKQLRQIIEEEVNKALLENGQEQAIRSVWEEFENNRASLPEDRHPDGTKREERACAARTEVRTLKDKDKDCWWCAETDSLTASMPKKGTC